jgi:hypothetical protein
MTRVWRQIAACAVTFAASDAFASLATESNALASLAPAVAITTPAPGSTVAGVVTVTATKTSFMDLTPAVFRVDGGVVAQVSTTSPWSAPWDTRKHPNGPHIISVNTGAGLSAGITITVTNPTCSDDDNPCTETPFVDTAGSCVYPLVGPNKNVTCRPATAGGCDISEYWVCDGATGTCPPDQYLAAMTTCRASAGPCDVAEYCSGLSDVCPSDLFNASTVTCRPAAGPCDVPEKCSGAGATCPSDEFVAESTVCRPEAGACDLLDYCSGWSADCPEDVRDLGEVCREAAGPCDVPEFCSGTSPACPNDALAQQGTPCQLDACACDSGGACEAVRPITTYCYDSVGNLTSRFSAGPGSACPALCEGEAFTSTGGHQ